MAQEIKNVIVVGASGNLGPHVVSALLGSKKFGVAVLTRANSNKAFQQGVTVVKTDYSPAHLEAALKGYDAVVSTIAGAAVGEQKKIIDAAVKAGVKRFLPSEFGSNTTNKYANDLVPVFSRKVQIVEYLKATASANPNFSWTALVTGPFFDRSLKNGVLGFDIKNKKAVIYDQGSRLFTTTILSTVGTGVVSVLTNLEATKNKYIFIGSLTTSQNAILAALEKAVGGTWTTEKTTGYGEVVADREKLAKGESTIIRPMVTAATYTEGTGSNFAVDEKLWNSELQLPLGDLDALVKWIVGS